MSPITHFLGSWLIATVTTQNPRDCTLVTLAGILPDADGLGIVADMINAAVSGKEPTFHYYQHYHHYLLHGWPAAIGIPLLLTGFARRRWRVLPPCLLTFHLHLVCDLLGSRGPTPGDLWPIAYGEPFFRHPVFFWKSQWRLDGWQNRIITVTLFLAELLLAPRRGYSCVGIFSRRLERVFIEVLRKWQGQLFNLRKSIETSSED